MAKISDMSAEWILYFFPLVFKNQQSKGCRQIFYLDYNIRVYSII